MDPAHVLREVIDSFSDVAYPGDDRIVEGFSGEDLERQRIAEQFRGHRWAGMPLEVLIENTGALAFFTPEAFRYYLPAYILVALSLYEDANTIPSDLVSALTLPTEHDTALVREVLARVPGSAVEALEEADALAQFYRSGAAERRFADRVTGLSPAQATSIRKALEYLRDAYGQDFPILGPQVALERYWSRF